MKKYLQEAIGMIRRDWRAYVGISFGYYALVVIGMIVVAFVPDLQQNFLKSVHQGLDQGFLKTIKTAYTEGHLTGAIGLTFVTNLVAGSFFTITVPSLLVPFSGVLTGLGRAVLWGLLLAPVDPHLRWIMVPHSVTLLLEGQAYVLAMFASWRLGSSLLRPRSVERQTAWEGYRVGLHQTLCLYSLVVAVLAAAAVYEALEIIYLAPLLKG